MEALRLVGVGSCIIKASRFALELLEAFSEPVLGTRGELLFDSDLIS